MPYTAATAPAPIKNALSGVPHAIEIWVAAFNASEPKYGVGRAAAIAWTAVKRKYRKAGDKWVAREGQAKAVDGDEGGDTPVMLVPDYVSLAGSAARGRHKRGDDLDVVVRQNSRSRDVEDHIRRKMAKADDNLHVHWKAQGPNGTHVPMFDLVMTPSRNRRRRKIGEPAGMMMPTEKSEGTELSLSFEACKANDEQQIVTGVVMLPDIPDTQRQAFSAPAITEAMYQFNTTLLGKRHFIRGQHGNLIETLPLESYQAPSELRFDEKTVPQGTWVMSIKVLDPSEWRKVKAGQYTGLSPRIRWRDEHVKPVHAGVGAN